MSQASPEITLYTASTPNGYKASIMLEELGVPYAVRALDLGALDQKQPAFLKINPNGRIPAIIDHAQDDFAVFESGAILVYLAERNGRFLPSNPKSRSQVIQWLMFQMGGLGPMQGQANVFHRYFPEKLPSVIDRYQNETRRLYEVLNTRLLESEYLAGTEYSIADIAAFPWVRVHDWAGVSVDGLDGVQRWLKVVEARPAVQRGLQVPPKAAADETVEMAKKMLA